MTRRVFIDAFLGAFDRHPDVTTVVVVDIIRASTTAVTAAHRGWASYPASSLDHAMELAGRLPDPLLVGELGGHTPYGFDLGNTPATIDRLPPQTRPMVLLSSSGTPLMTEAGERFEHAYVGSLRTVSALTTILAAGSDDVLVVGAGTRGRFRAEDQLGCAWIAAALGVHGFEAADTATATVIARWGGQPVEAMLASESVEYLRRTGQLDDLDFIVEHVDDLPCGHRLADGRVVEVGP